MKNDGISKHICDKKSPTDKAMWHPLEISSSLPNSIYFRASGDLSSFGSFRRAAFFWEGDLMKTSIPRVIADEATHPC